MADFDAQLPVRTIATEFTTEVANAAGTTINPAEDYAQASTTSGQNGVLAQGAVTTAAPTYTTGTTNPLSLDGSGNLRVTFTGASLQNVNVTQWDSIALGAPTAYGTAPSGNVIGVNAYITNTPAVTLTSTTITGTVTVVQPTGANLNVDVSNFPALSNVNVTEWNSIALGSPTAYGTAPSGNVIGVNADVTNVVAISAASLPLPTGASTSALQTAGNASLTTIATNTTPLAQGSTTAGESGNLSMGAVTTAAPTYSTGTTNPLSLDTSGNLRVVGTFGTAPSTLTYFTDAAVATGATVTHSVAGPVSLSHVHASGSGEIKMNVAIGITGSEVDKWVGFTSAAVQNCEFNLQDVVTIPSGSSVKVTLKNRDTAAQDLYLTIEAH